MNKPVKLIFVSEDNHNKFYNMTDLGNGTFKSGWGRVDVTHEEKIYSISEWDKKYKEKIKKGYSDKTDLYTEVVHTSVPKTQLKGITDKEVNDLIIKLQGYSNKSISNNYSVKVSNVTKHQIDVAQDQVNKLLILNNLTTPLKTINDNLLELYQIIPRKMNNVKNYIFECKNGEKPDNNLLVRFNEMIGNEQDLLDVMAQQVRNQPTNQTQTINILDLMGLDIKTVNDSIIINDITNRIIKGLYNKNNVNKIYEVTNKKTRNKFDKYLNVVQNKYKELLYHGSRNENFLSILETGLVLRPSSAIRSGSMYGEGIYYANKSGKSLNYSSLRGSHWSNGSDNIGYLALFEVHLGNQLKAQRHESWMSQLNLNNLRSKGDYDSFYALGGVDLINDEFIVYKEEQSTIKYLVEMGV